MGRYRGLVEATRVVAASAGRGVDGVVAALVEQTANLLDVPDVSVRLGGEDGVSAEAFALTPAVSRRERETTLVVPLVADDEVVGVLVVRWARPQAPEPEEIELVEALGQHAAIALRSARLLEAARLDAAVKTARRATHELSNQLALVAGYSELLRGMADGPLAEMAERMQVAAMAAGQTMARLQGIVRFEETEFGGQVMLDLERATRRT